MGRSSKKRKAERKAQRRLSQQLAEINEAGQIPLSVATEPKLPDTLSYLDGNNYQLIFERYNHKDCEIPDLDNKDAKALVGKFNEITRVNNRSIAGTNLVKHKVKNEGDYTSLFKGLEDDIELYEVQYAGTGRIICYFINQYPHNNETTSNYCCVIAILKKHRRT